MNDLFKKITNWLFRDEDDEVVLTQLPNWQLTGAITAWLLQFVISDGTFHDTMRVIFTVLMVFWAYEEIVNGVNGFRRILGAIVLAIICINLYTLLEAA